MTTPEGFPGELLAHYEPVRRVGEGATGIVYEARQRGAGRSVAVKVIAPRHLGTPGARRAFLREAQAIVRLKHPHVVELIDFDAPPGASAWLVTEFLGGGHLGTWRQHWPGWQVLLGALDGALAGLAWAHARGVVHCDIKPENILLEARAPIARAKLADFGVVRLAAHSAHASSSARQWRTDQLSGTPTYMAPEQAEGDLGAYGPWTDIYALGIVLWEILAGRPPFDAESVSGILLKHIYEPLPLLALRPEVPRLPAIEPLLAGMLAKDPWDRPRFAAALRDALGALGDEAAALDLAHAAPVTAQVPAVSAAAAELGGAVTLTAADAQPVVAGRATLPSAGRIGAVRSAAELAAVSGSLQRLRAVEAALVGRGDEMRTLLSAAEAVRIERRPTVILLEGPAGIGKTRLAQALRESLEEQGQMQSWSGSYRVETGGASGGLRGAVESFYLCLGRDRRQIGEALEGRLRRLDGRDPWELKALVGWLRPERDDAPLPDASAVGLALRAAQRAALRHPLCIWLDDVHNALEGQVLPFAERLLRAPRDGSAAPTLGSGLLRPPAPDAGEAELPVLLLLTGRPCDADSDPSGLVRGQLERLERDPYFVRLQLGPLSAHAITRLLVEEIGLSAEQAARISERTGGRPHVALQAARATVQLAGLQSSAESALSSAGRDAVTLLGEEDQLVEPARPAVVSPLSSGRLLEGYVAEVLGTLPQPASERVLGMLALLGPSVAPATLRAALGHAWPHDRVLSGALELILERASSAGLVDRGDERGEGRIHLDHEPLTRLLAARLERRGESSLAHQAAAEALRQTSGRALAARARHLRQAERPSDAWVLMLSAVEDAVEHARYSEAVSLASELDAWLDGWGEQPDSERRGLLLRAMARAAIRCGALHEAARHLDAELARFSEDAAVLAERALLRAELLAGRGDFVEAIAAFDAARIGYGLLGEHGRQARALLGLAGALRVQGELERGRRAAEEALALFGALGEQRGRAAALRALGQIDVYLGELDTALASYEAALGLFEALGDLHGTADAQRGLGGVWLELAQPEAAQQVLRAALSVYETIGDLEGAGHTLRGLARARTLRGQPDAARSSLERAVHHFEQIGARMGAASCRLDLASVLRTLAASSPPATRTEVLSRAVEALELAMEAFRHAGDERGLASCLMTLGNILLDAGQHAEAIARHQEALRLYWRVGHPRGVLLARLNLGHAHLCAGHHEEAHGLLAQAESEARDADARALARLAAAYQALVELARGNLDAVAASFARVTALASEAGEDDDEAMPPLELAMALERLAEDLEAHATDRDLALRALAAAAAVHEAHGQHAERRRLLARRDALRSQSALPRPS